MTPDSGIQRVVRARSQFSAIHIVAAILATNVLAIPTAFALDPELPAYRTVPRISGQISSVGSDSLNNEMMLWATGFHDRYPDVKINVEGMGSATAPPALLQGASQFGPMSRAVTSEEADAFESKYSYKGVQLPSGDRCAGGLCQQG